MKALMLIALVIVSGAVHAEVSPRDAKTLVKALLASGFTSEAGLGSIYNVATNVICKQNLTAGTTSCKATDYVEDTGAPVIRKIKNAPAVFRILAASGATVDGAAGTQYIQVERLSCVHPNDRVLRRARCTIGE